MGKQLGDPRSSLYTVGLREDSLVETAVVYGGFGYSAKCRAPLFLRELLAEVADENIHVEISTSPALGNEIW